ncbi:MAG: hypothetical protein ABIJ09_16300 [Pseudomonadota bacterium]
MDLLKHTARGLAIVVVVLPAALSAQVLSPGPLARPHTKLEGLRQCTKCHELGAKVDGKLCLECHRDLAQGIARQRGMHAQAEVKDKGCLSCHRDHRGIDASLTEWKGSREQFDHKRSGWALDGKHAKAACAACHRAALVRAPELRKRLGDGKEPATYLGLDRSCNACHFDEHRGQLGKACQRCHDATAFAPARGFDHASVYKLRGAHAKTSCLKCHPAREVEATASAILPPVKPTQVVDYRGVGARGCASCHSDVHRGKFGQRCERCHVETSWSRTHISKAQKSFHDKSRFPLRGLHEVARCGTCHPAKKGGGLQTRGLAFERCDDCHRDAHFGQVADEGGRGTACERCHDEQGFYPPRYNLARHDKGPYPLEGAHRAVACNACHPPDPERFSAKLPASVRDAPEPVRRTELYNFTRLRRPEVTSTRCDSCHRDVHGGQFARGEPVKPCSACHQLDSFAQPRFDHDRDSRFALTGKHREASCARCHQRRQERVEYRGTARVCATCHTDVHRGQFGDLTCERCHDTQKFKPSRFVHGDPAFGDITLTGAHARVPCARCHPSVPIEGGSVVAWYRGVPRRCDGCHQDVHAQPGGGGAR